MTDNLPWASRFDLSTKAIGLVATFCLAASLLYDWGFYFALDLSFIEVPSVLSDHVRSALLWFPKVAVSLGVLLINEMFLQRMEKGMTEDEIIATSPTPTRTRRFRESPQKLFTLTAMIGVIGYVIAGDIFIGVLPIGLSICWMTFSVWAQSPERLLVRRPVAVRLAIHVFPPIAMWLFFTGYNDAVRLYQPSAGSSQISIRNTSNPESVVLLRQLDKGLLVKEQNGAVGFRPWSEIEKIETPGRYIPRKGLICNWIGVGCLPASPVSMPLDVKCKSIPTVQGTQRDKAAQRP